MSDPSSSTAAAPAGTEIAAPAAAPAGPKVNFKVSGSTNFSLDLDSSIITVKQLKEKVAEHHKMAVEQQKLVFKGKVLKDEDVLTDRKIKDGATVFLVKGAADKAASSSSGGADKENKDEKKEDAPASSIQCAGGCGFWGNPKMENMCSKCFKDKQEKDEAEILKKQEEAEKKDKEAEDAKNKEVEKVEEEKKKEKPVQENKTRCWLCNKRCGLAGIECRCGYVYCTAHRLPENHDCDFDYKTCGREQLRKTNDKVEADKLVDRL